MLAWRNLWRHQRRTLVMLFALVLGVWSMIVMAALIRGSMEEQVRRRSSISPDMCRSMRPAIATIRRWNIASP